MYLGPMQLYFHIWIVIVWYQYISWIIMCFGIRSFYLCYREKHGNNIKLLNFVLGTRLITKLVKELPLLCKNVRIKKTPTNLKIFEWVIFILGFFNKNMLVLAVQLYLRHCWKLCCKGVSGMEMYFR